MVAMLVFVLLCFVFGGAVLQLLLLAVVVVMVFVLVLHFI